MSPLTGRLENWYIQASIALDEYMIWGNLYDDVHERWVEGHHIHTSGIDHGRHPLDTLAEGAVVATRNSVYKLGVPYDTE